MRWMLAVVALGLLAAADTTTAPGNAPGEFPGQGGFPGAPPAMPGSACEHLPDGNVPASGNVPGWVNVPACGE